LHFTTQTDDSHAVPFETISNNQIKFNGNSLKCIGKIKRGLSN